MTQKSSTFSHICRLVPSDPPNYMGVSTVFMGHFSVTSLRIICLSSVARTDS